LNFKGELVRAEREKAGLTQKELAEKANYSRAMISKIESGRKKAKKHDLILIAQALNSMYLMIAARGTTTLPIVFDQINDDFYVAANKFLQECQEAIEAVEDVLCLAHNVETIEDCSDEQKESIMYALTQVCDVNHACDVVDCAAGNMGFDIEKRNRKNLEKYRQRNYLSYGARPDLEAAT